MGQELVIKWGDGTEGTVVVPLRYYNQERRDYHSEAFQRQQLELRIRTMVETMHAVSATGWTALIRTEALDFIVVRAPLQLAEFPGCRILMQLGDRVHADMVVRDWLAEEAHRRERELVEKVHEVRERCAKFKWTRPLF